jgi:3-hydroxyisobutyrate dehydrogenase-like beta-hydroxyacid dehydrogenase
MSETTDTLGSIGLGFIGLGVMGGPMCRNLVKKHGGPVHAFDMSPDALEELREAGAIPTGSITELARAVQVIFLSLPGGQQVRAVCAEIADVAAPGTLIVDLSTTSVADARAVAALLAENNVSFVDAPVARTRQAAQEGTLSIMVGASEELFARVQPLLSYMATDVTHCGEVGCGQVVKLINNCLLFEHVAALAELMVVAERAGVGREKLIEAVSLGSGDSFALRNHGLKAMAPGIFPEKAFPSAYALKDLGYAIELAEQTGVEPRLPRLAAQYYQTAVEKGIGNKYFPAIIELIEKE